MSRAIRVHAAMILVVCGVLTACGGAGREAEKGAPAVLAHPDLRRLQDRDLPTATRLEALEAIALVPPTSGSEPAAWRHLAEETSLHPGLETRLRSWLEAHPADPGLLRFLAAAFRAESPRLRIAAICASAENSQLFLAGAKDEAVLVEVDEDVRLAWLEAMKVRRPRDSMLAAAMAWIAEWETSGKQRLVDAAATGLLGAARLGATWTKQSDARWWRGPGSVVQGVDAASGPVDRRTVTVATVTVRSPVSRDMRFLLAYRLDASRHPGALRAEVFAQGEAIGFLDFHPGPADLEKVATASWTGVDLSSFEIRFPEGVPEGLELSRFAVVRHQVVPRARGQRHYGFRAARGREILGGAEVAKAPRCGEARLFDRDVFTLEFELPESAVADDVASGLTAISHLHIIHGSPSEENSTWTVSLNGRPLVTLISQPEPRPGRADLRRLRRVADLKAGTNILRFRRVEGPGILLDGLRLY